MPAMRADRRGFTVAELLIVVAIIAVLVGVAIPVFNNQAERAREATDAANIRSAYAEVRTSYISDDRSEGSGWDATKQRWEKKVNLKQTSTGWASDEFRAALDGLCTSGTQSGSPYVRGCAYVRCMENGSVVIYYPGSTINEETAKNFLTKEILSSILEVKDANGNIKKYPHAVVDSEETHAGFGTERFKQAMKDIGFDLEAHGAASWTIYAKDANGQYLDTPSIYFTPEKISQDESAVGTRVPVIGYRDGHYDVYIMKVARYPGDGSPYNGLSRLGAATVSPGGSASFQYENWEDAQAAYDCVKKAVDNGSTEGADAILSKYNFKVLLRREQHPRNAITVPVPPRDVILSAGAGRPTP